MPRAAPRISRRLVAVVVRASREPIPIAEINRRVGAEADRLGLPRPSYEQVRVLTHEIALRRERRRELASDLVDGALDPLVLRQWAKLGRTAVGAVDEAARSWDAWAGRPK